MKRMVCSVLAVALAGVCGAQEDAVPGALIGPATVEAMRGRLDAATQGLTELRRTIAEEKLPLTRALHAAEQAVSELRREQDAVKRQADGAALEAASLRNEIKQRETERNYLVSLFGEYARNFETRLHIAELAQYKESLGEARGAAELVEADPVGAFDMQLRLILMSLARLEEMAGGLTFRGPAASEDGLVKNGRFLLYGPVAYFASEDGELVGVANQRVGSLIPVVESYADAAFTELARTAVTTGRGEMPFDASLGNARKIEQTRETLREHFDKGGPVMYPMLGLFACCMLVALLKWVTLTCTPLPRARRLAELLDAVRNRDVTRCAALAARLRGPAGRMLRAGCAVLEQPKELIEEAMFEKMLEAKFRLNRLLPFIAVTAACAPLLGLLGTVTGIISTFKLMTVFGSGDVKMLSSGISEALITTEFGLYVAIPSVMLHAFLSRKARRIGDRMEQIAIRFMGEVGRV